MDHREDDSVGPPTAFCSRIDGDQHAVAPPGGGFNAANERIPQMAVESTPIDVDIFSRLMRPVVGEMQTDGAQRLNALGGQVGRQHVRARVGRPAQVV